MPGNFLIDPIDFLEKNLVIPNHGNIGSTQGDSGIRTMCLVRSPNPARKLGQNVDRWFLGLHDPRIAPDRIGAIFDAYWCPYSQNQTLTCMLGLDSPYMFTATMDGCSFGIGHQPGGGVCRVAHANEGTFGANREEMYGLDGARQFQRSEQQKRLAHAVGDGVNVISPLDYMADIDGAMELKSTTFGYRDGGDWKFYTQKYWRNGNTYFLRDVTRQY